MTEGARLGIVGTGYIASHLGFSLVRRPEYVVHRILTRRDPSTVSGFPERVITNSIDDLVSNSDLIVECSGDPIWATEVIGAAVEASRPVVTMNTEFHITAGSAFADHLVTEAEGDQPGSLAALHEEAVLMGFEPLVYGNLKGFYNPDPSYEDMSFWASKQGFSIEKVTSFTDGTKVEAEQILVGNRFGADIGPDGMTGYEVGSIEEGAEKLVELTRIRGSKITDFVVNRSFPHGVFVVATHDDRQARALANVKMGSGPHYTLLKHDTFVHLEVVKTIKRVLDTGRVLLNNSTHPTLSLAAVAKRRIERGERIDTTFGSFAIGGRAVRIADHPRHVPLGLLQGAVLEERIEPGGIVSFDQVDLVESGALKAYRSHHLNPALAPSRTTSAG